MAIGFKTKEVRRQEGLPMLLTAQQQEKMPFSPAQEQILRAAIKQLFDYMHGQTAIGNLKESLEKLKFTYDNV